MRKHKPSGNKTPAKIQAVIDALKEDSYSNYSECIDNHRKTKRL
jgi:hypothetical protein